MHLQVKQNALPLTLIPLSRLLRVVGMVNWYSWFWKSLNMADQRGEFGFFRGVYVKINIRTDTSTSIKPKTTKFGKQVHLKE